MVLNALWTINVFVVNKLRVRFSFLLRHAVDGAQLGRGFWCRSGQLSPTTKCCAGVVTPLPPVSLACEGMRTLKHSFPSCVLVERGQSWGKLCSTVFINVSYIDVRYTEFHPGMIHVYRNVKHYGFSSS